MSVLDNLSEIKLNHLEIEVENINKALTNNLNCKEMATIQDAKETANTLRNFNGRCEHLESVINAVDKFFDRHVLQQQFIYIIT